MNTKQKLAYIAIGGLLVATGMIISPLNAQKEKFGEIECERLNVTRKIRCESLHVDKNGGSTYVDGSSIIIKNRTADGMGGDALFLAPTTVTMKADKGASIQFSTLDMRLLDLKINPGMTIEDADGNLLASIGYGEHGGYVLTNGRSKGSAMMGINKYGNGGMATSDKNGYRQ